MLHAGCGETSLPAWLMGHDEVRLDIDPAVGPDIVASFTDLGAIGPFDLIYCSHALEHLHPGDVAKALREFHRVLTPGGRAVVYVPDLEDVKPTEDVLFVSPGGPITGRDLYYGKADLVGENPHMAHRTGFVAESLEAAFYAAGFAKVATARIPFHNLLAGAVKA